MKPAGQMTITLTPELEQFVRREAEKGGFASNSEYIRDVLRERYLKAREREEARAHFEASLDRAIKEIEDGKGVPVEDAFREIRRRLGIATDLS